MNTGIGSPVAGFVAYRPVNTPVLASIPAVRCRSLRRAATSWYATTASRGVHVPALPPASSRPSGYIHSGGVPSGHDAGGSRSASGCSGASTTYVAPGSVSGRVLKTSTVSSSPAVPATSATGRSIRAPSLGPTQFRCCCLIDSGHCSGSRSAISRSANAVMRSIHCRSGLR